MDALWKYEIKSLDKVRIVNQNTHFKPENIFFLKIEWGILGVPKGPLNNYVDKIREEGVKKVSVFVHAI